MRQTGRINNYEFNDADSNDIHTFTKTRNECLRIDFSLRNLPATIHLDRNMAYHYRE